MLILVCNIYHAQCLLWYKQMFRLCYFQNVLPRIQNYFAQNESDLCSISNVNTIYYVQRSGRA